KSTDFSDTRLLDMYEQKEAMEKAVQEAEIAWYAGRGKLEEVENSIRDIRKVKEQQEYMLSELKERANQLRLQETGLAERLSVEFEIEVADIRERESAPESDADSL